MDALDVTCTIGLLKIRCRGEWIDGEEYGVGDHVTREGKLFVSLSAENDNDPLNDETPATWEIPKRFGDNECANELWEKYLIRLVSSKVYHASINFDTQKTGANGLTMLDGASSFNGQGFRTSDKGERIDYKKSLEVLQSSIVTSMIRWVKGRIKDNDCTSVPLSTIPGCGKSNEGCAPSQQKRRWGFKY